MAEGICRENGQEADLKQHGWTGLFLEEAFIRATKERTVLWKIAHDAANPRTLDES